MEDRHEQTATDTNAMARYIRAAREKGSTAPAPRPWLLAVVAVVCAGLVVVGSVGPWMYYERVSVVAPHAWTLYGVRTDGAFTLLFAIIAIIALIVAVFTTDSEGFAWGAVVTLALCALTGLLGWLVFAPPEVRVDIGQEGNIQRVEWGMKLTGLAGLAGAICAFIVARSISDH